MAKFALLLCLLAQLRSALTDDTEYYLVKDLFRNYDKRLRPSFNHTDVLNVTFGIALQNIMEVDERNQVIITNCWLNQGWVDVRLRWNPVAHHGIEEIRLPVSTVWTPDIILYNNADPMSYVSTISTNVMIRYDGNITWLSTAILKSSCQITVRDFPFDNQECYLQFASWTYGGRQMDMTQVSELGDTSVYKLNTEWNLVQFASKRNLNNFSCCPEPWPDITYYIRITRRPLFYVFNLILPCILISVVAMFGFLVPCDSGEKITTTITTLLSMTVFLLLVIEQLPPSAIALPLIGVYYGITMAIVSAATVATVVTLNLYYKNDSESEVPPYVKVICFEILAPLFLINVKSELRTGGKAYSGRALRHDETTFYSAAGSAGNHCGSPLCSCSVQNTTNGGCSSLGQTYTSQPTLPLLCCPHEYKPCAARSPFGATVSPQNTVRCGSGSAASSVKDAPSVNRLQSLLRPGAAASSASSTCDCGRDHDGLGAATMSAELRNLVAHRYFGNQSFSRPPYPEREPERAAERSDRLPELGELLAKVLRSVELQEQRATDSDRQLRIRREWRLLALVVDRCFFWLFILTTSIMTGVLFSKAL